MALRNQGFEKSLNLAESVDDRQILNNLAGSNIQLDIALFRNNKRNTSTLVWQFNTSGSTITDNRFVFPTTVPFVYTNGDVVKVTGSSLGNLNTVATYYVVDFAVGLGTLRNQSAFGLSLTKGGSRISLGAVGNSVTFIRADEVVRDNIFNISSPETLEQNISSEGTRFRYEIGATFNDAFDTVDGFIDASNFLRSQKYTTNTSIATDRTIKIEGSVLTTDPAAYNSTAANMSQSMSPGIFITDPFSDVLNISKTRAYSTNSQPWVEETGKLRTKSAQVNIGDLYFENGIKLDSFDGLEVLTGSVTEFTHKLPVKINGVDYFILVRSV